MLQVVVTAVEIVSSSLLSDDVVLLVLSDRRRALGREGGAGGEPGEFVIDEFIRSSSILARSVVVNCLR